MVSTPSADASRTELPAFWNDYLVGVEGFAPIGIHIEATEQRSGRSVVVESLRIEEAIAEQLAAIRGNSTHAAVPLSVWSMLIARYTGEKDTLFGFLEDAEQQLPLPVRIALAGEDHLSTWLANNADYADASEALVPELRDAVASRTVGDEGETSYASIVVGCRSREELIAVAERALVDAQSARLFFTMVESGDGTELLLASNGAVASDALNRVLQHCARIADALVRTPDEPLAAVDILSSDERERVVNEWNNTDREYDGTYVLHEAIEAQVRRTPDAVALSMGEESLTYAQLNAKANQLARCLRDRGVADGSLVGVCMERSLEMVISLIAVEKAGGAYVPLDPTYPADRLESMLDDVDAPVVLAQRRLLGEIEFGEAETFAVDDMQDALAMQSDDDLGIDISPDQLAYVIFTSGSTGRPKGAMNTHRAICNRLYWMQEKFGLDATDVVLQKTPFSFDVSVWEFFWPFMTGAKLVVAKPEGHKDRSYLVDLVVDAGITTMHFVPSMLQLFLGDPKVGKCSASLRRVICSGEALPYSLKEAFFRKLDAGLFNLYGPTEAAVDVTYHDCVPDPDGNSVPIGRPVANTQIYLLDPNLKPVPIGVAGELHIGGVQVGQGYLKRPELTAEKFISDPFSGTSGAMLYKTGDLARFAEDGSILYLGRIDHQVKLRGLRIELGEIESVLDSHAGVNEAIVNVAEGEDDEKRLVAYVVPRRDYEAVSQEADDRVEQVQTIFDQTYFQDATTVDPTFNIVGWNSSYTGEAIPESEMRVWVETTVERILDLEPSSVLEMGCGTGMLLFRVAPSCEQYIGADFSHVALEQLRELLSQPEYARPNVELMQRPADDYTGLAARSIDTVVINSVVQLFPSIDYLVEVISGALDHLQPGGKMFIGDVRSKNHLLAYHASVETFRATESTPCSQLYERVKRRAELEEELLIEPAFFYALKNQFPQILDVDIQLKRGDFQNELTRFRYDVTLTVTDGSTELADPSVRAWSEFSGMADLEAAISTGDLDGVLVTGIPNARLQNESAILNLLEGGDAPHTVGALREQLQTSSDDGIEPEAIWDLCSRFAHSARIRWSIAEGEFCFDALITRKDNETVFRFPPFPVPDGASWASFANDPLIGIQARNLVPELRSHLKEKLPDYMVPAAFVVMEEFPLSPNGKVDRKRLPAADFGSPEVASDYVAPRNEAEKLLCEVWSDVLGLSRVGVNDNFFDVGGDSILNIQVVSRAAKVGIRLTPLQLFKHQTVAELAEAAQSSTVVDAEQGSISGEQFLSPMQHWVIDKAPNNLDRSNQILCLTAKQRLDEERVRAVVQKLAQQHDALRLEFQTGPSGEILACHYAAEAPGENFGRVEIVGGLTEAELEDRITETIGQTSASLKVGGGPLWKVVLVDSASDDRSRVIFCLHHLVADGFSGRILTDDFAAMYLQAARGEDIVLPRKTTSFQAAGERMEAHAASDELRRELGYWQGHDDARPCQLPADRNSGNDDEQSERTLSARLSAEATAVLLKDAAKAYRSRVNELLIAALARVLCRWTGQSAIQMETEGHGREEIFEDFDLSRTVGVFAAMFPILIEVDTDAPVSRTVRSVKSQFRTIPSSGLGFGFLSYLGSDEERASLASLPAADILFNYLGQFDQSGAQSELFEQAFYLDTSDRTPEEIRTHTLDVITWVVDGELNIRWTYSENRHARQTIQVLADAFVNEIESLIALESQDETSLSTDDFPLVSISESELSRIAESVPSVDKIYPLTPLQEGMLFHALFEPDSDVYYVQLNGKLAADLDAQAFSDAWRTVVKRHDIYRTHFLSDAGSRALQIVSAQGDLDVKIVDLSALDDAEVSKRLGAAREARRDGYTIKGAPLMSIRLFKTRDAHYVYWNFHHLLLDGASMVATVEEVFELYEQLVDGKRVDEHPAAHQFGDFVAWREQQSVDDARSYWAGQMSGVTQATALPGADTSSASGHAEFRKLSFELSGAASEAFRDRIKEKRLTPNSVVHGAWGLLLGARSGSGPVVFGSVVPGRSPMMPGSEAVIGLCMNTLPVAVAVRAEESVSDWLARLQADLVEMREFDYFPLVDIQRCTSIPSGTPMFESVIAVQGYLGKHSSLRSWARSFGLDELEFIDWNDLPLSLAVEVGESIEIVLKYKSSAFTEDAASTLKDEFEFLMHELPRTMDESIDTLQAAFADFRQQRSRQAKQDKRASAASQLRRIRRKRVSD